MSATVRLPVRHIPSSAEPFGAGVLAFPFASAALAAGVSEPDRLLWEELHPAARTAQITASAVTPIGGLPRRGCRFPCPSGMALGRHRPGHDCRRNGATL